MATDLLAILTAAAHALEAQRFGLDVAGENIANVNTAGYTRRIARFEAIPPTAAQEAGRGVRIAGVTAIRDPLIEARLRNDISDRDYYAASSDILSQVEAVIGLPGQSIDSDINRFFDSFSQLADNAASTVARQQVIFDGESLAASIRAMADQLDQSRSGADRYIRQSADTINELAARIALLNADMAKVPADRTAPHERDQIIEAIKELAEHVDVVVVERGDQRALDVYIGSGRPLVVGVTTFNVNVVSVGPSGFADIEHQGVSITSELTGGRIAGYVSVRDVEIPSYISQLDQLAYTLAQQVNTLHTSGFDLSGTAGGNFFVPIGTVAGAAAAFTVDTTLAADTGLVVAAGVAQAGDNQVARSLSALRDQQVLNGGTATFDDYWGQLVFTAGNDAATSNGRLEGRSEAARQTAAAWDAMSAVSLDEEALQLTRFQRAYQANAVMFRTINETIDIMMRMVGA